MWKASLLESTRRGEVDRVRDLLETEDRKLTADLCFRAFGLAIDSHQPEVGHLLLDHAEKAFDGEAISGRIEEGRILHRVAGRNMVSLVKRLAQVVNMAEYECEDSPLVGAVIEGHSEMVKVLLDAGCSAYKLLACSYFDTKYIYPAIIDRSDESKEVWALILSRLTAEDVIDISSDFLEYLISIKKGGLVLSSFELIGMQFTPYISSCNERVKACVKYSLDKRDLSSVKFFIDHRFDMNVPLVGNSTTALHYVIEMLYSTTSVLFIIFEILKSGANPCISDDKDRSVEDLCIKGIGDQMNPAAHAIVLKLIVRLGFNLSQTTKHFVQTSTFPELSDFTSEINSVPDLQCLCRNVIRMEKESKTREFVEHLEYPQKLKDFVLLKDFEWDERRKL